MTSVQARDVGGSRYVQRSQSPDRSDERLGGCHHGSEDVGRVDVRNKVGRNDIERGGCYSSGDNEIAQNTDSCNKWLVRS